MAGPFMTVHQYDELKKLKQQHGRPDSIGLCIDEEPYGIVYAIWKERGPVGSESNNSVSIVHIKPDGDQMDFEEEHPEL